MGFLLGAFGKLAAGSRYRSLQARLMRVQSRLRRATRDIADMTKQLDRQKKAELNQITMAANQAKYNGQQNLMETNGIAAIAGKLGNLGSTSTEQLSDTERQQLAAYNQGMNDFSVNLEQNIAMAKKQIEDRYDYLNDTMLEPLKDEEDSLQLEKDTLESQLQIAKADYEACQKMEQADAQMMKPNYTGAA